MTLATAEVLSLSFMLVLVLLPVEAITHHDKRGPQRAPQRRPPSLAGPSGPSINAQRARAASLKHERGQLERELHPPCRWTSLAPKITSSTPFTSPSPRAVSVLAGSVLAGILRTRALRAQNRFVFMVNTSVSDALTGLSVYYLGMFDVQEGYPSRNGTFHVLPLAAGGQHPHLHVCPVRPLLRRVPSPSSTAATFPDQWSVARGVYCWFHIYAQLLASNVVPVATAAQI
ncbi:hypothetical protein AOLI_G00033500 [Acnodon oligacanthus]